MSRERKDTIVAMFSRSRFRKLVTRRTLKLLPLKPESINKWNLNKSDIARFLKQLCDIQAVQTHPDGRKEKVNYQFYWRIIWGRGLKQFIDFSKEFRYQARKHEPSPASIINKVKVPSFLDDEYYGLVAKYYIAYDGILDKSLSESHFYSIAHILESQEELDCSILLAKNLYYKQSLQVLRNFLELMVSQILFCYDPTSFEKWRNGSFMLTCTNR